MTVEQSIKNAMSRMLERTLSIESVEVISWEEEFNVYSFGGCSTCGPEFEKEYSVEIWYRDSGTKSDKYYHFAGKFTELIKELDDNG
jgi:hypothetical protein